MQNITIGYQRVCCFRISSACLVHHRIIVHERTWTINWKINSKTTTHQSVGGKDKRNSKPLEIARHSLWNTTCSNRVTRNDLHSMFQLKPPLTSVLRYFSWFSHGFSQVFPHGIHGIHGIIWHPLATRGFRGQTLASAVAGEVQLLSGAGLGYAQSSQLELRCLAEVAKVSGGKRAWNTWKLGEHLGETCGLIWVDSLIKGRNNIWGKFG